MDGMETPTMNHGSASATTPSQSQNGFVNSPRKCYLDNADTDNDETRPLPIAVCGVAMRLPGGIRDGGSFWDFLVNGRDARRPIPRDRYNADGFDSKLGAKGAIEAQHGYFLDEDLGTLDSSFFSMTADELGKTDPQQRQILEVTRECLENAGETNYQGKPIGCYVGTFAEDWLRMGARDSQHSGRYLVTGHSDLMIANRVSFDMVIKTGCSASLVALHEACRALQSNDCVAAIVAGTNLILGPMTTAEMTQEGILSPQGSCRTFDAAADGFARAEAVNAVYIKKLDDAIRDRNPIRAIIRNTATNSDGRSSSIMQPNGESHEMLMRKIYRDAGLDPNLTAFVECHGTGTATGDPIEASAVGNVFGEKGMLIGSVKPNIGHSEGASGLSSLIKAVLTLEHKVIPPNIKFDVPNPKGNCSNEILEVGAFVLIAPVPFMEMNLRVPTKPMAWPLDRALRVSINSFGIGGSNAHVILDSSEEFSPDSNGLDDSRNNHAMLLPLSANSQQSLKQQIINTLEYIKCSPNSIPDLVYTLSLRREYLPHRAFAIIEESSAAYMSSNVKAPAIASSVTMIFSGQGAQWPGMGVKLLETDTKFRNNIRSMDKMLQNLRVPPKWTLEGELKKPHEIGLVHALSRVGIRPSAVIGHSSGEIAAAYACGALSLRGALIIAYYRGLITKERPANGGMAAIGLGADEVSAFLCDGVVIACENSEDSTTISGDVDSLKKVLAQIQVAKPETLVRKLRVGMAYHSPHMISLGTEYKRLMVQELEHDDQEFGTLKTAFFSSVTTKITSASELSKPSYWVSNLISPVLFKSAVNNALLTQNKDIFLEVGPHSTLAGPLRNIFSRLGLACPYIPLMLRDADCEQTLLSAFGQLYQSGASIKFDELVPQGRVLTDLPVYPWDHSTSYWYELLASRDWRFRKHGHHGLLGLRVPETTHSGPCWRNALSIEDEPWLYDHKIQDAVVFPFAGYCVMAGEAMRQISGTECGFRLTRVEANSAMRLSEGKTVEIRTTLIPRSTKQSAKPEAWNFAISSYSESGWVVNCEGQVRALGMSLQPSFEPKELLRDVQPSQWYDALARVGIVYGPLFKRLSSIQASPKEKVASGRINLIDSQLSEPYPFHPVALDACLHLSTVALAKGRGLGLANMSIPTTIQEINVFRSAAEMTVKAWSLDDGKTLTIECVADGVVVLHLSGLEMTQLGDEVATPDDDHYAGAQLEWRPHFDFLDQGALFRPPHFDKERTTLREEVVLLCAIDCAERLRSLPTRESHLLKYQKWLEQRVRQAKAGAYPVIERAQDFVSMTKSSRKSSIEDTLAQLFSISSNDPIATAVKRIWKTVENIFTGEDSALDLLSRDEILTQIYNSCSFDHSQFVQTLSHTNPNLRILEVGAGTGGTTQSILKDLVDAGGYPMYNSYTFTDVSDGFFPRAKQRFSHAPNMEYKVFDISKDPVKQGFEPQTYDLILATNVVHATPSLHETLSNLRPLLKENGSLILTEITTTLSVLSFVFGTLPGWWLGEGDDRLAQPYVSVERWDRELQASGFTGADTVVYDGEQPYQSFAAIVTGPRPSTSKLRSSKEIAILCDSSDTGVARLLIAGFIDAGYSCAACRIDDESLPRRDIISTLGLENEFFADMSESRFTTFQKLLRNHTSQKVLWLTPPSQLSCQNPRSAQAIGIARTIRTETGIPFHTLEIESEEPGFENLVLRVFVKIQATDDTESLIPDREFAVCNGMVYVGRYHPFSMQESQNRLVKNDDQEERTLEIDKFNDLHGSPHWTQGFHTEQVPDDHVEIEVRTSSLDVAIAQNLVRESATTGPARTRQSSGLAGTVRRVGSRVEHVSVSDRIMAVWPTDSNATNVVLPGSLVVKMPEPWSFEQAASVPASFVTAIRALINVGHLAKGQSILLQSPASTIGHAALLTARAVGAEVYIIVETEAEAQYLIDTYEFPKERVYQATVDFPAAQLIQDTEGHGMDVVVNWSRNDIVIKSACKCVARYGRFVEVGSDEINVFDKFDVVWFSANRSFCSVNLVHFAQDLPSEVHRILERILEWQQQGKIHPIQHIASLPTHKVDREVQPLLTNEHIEKPAITVFDDLSKIEATAKRRTLSLDSEAAYLLTGGFGGLGMALVNWLVEHGARNLVVISRSAGQTDESEKFVVEMASLGCSIVPVSGKVNSQEDVERAIAKVGRPIKGVVHMAMVLRDSPISTMSHADWTAATDPKVNGAWVLHNALINQPLEFFLLTSSLFTAIEHPGQGNYNAANTFLEAFCQYRHHLGLPASVLNICPIDGVGFFATNAVAKKKMKAQGFYFLGEQAFLDFAELSILDSSPPSINRPTDAWSAWRNPRQTFMGLRSELHLDNPKNRASWRRDRRMALYHNLKAFSGGEHESDLSQLKELLSNASIDPDILMDKSSRDLIAFKIGEKVLEYRLRPDEEVDTSLSLVQIGMDSLKAIELRRWWKQTFRLDIKIFEIMESRPLQQLGELTADRIRGMLKGENGTG